MIIYDIIPVVKAAGESIMPYFWALQKADIAYKWANNEDPLTKADLLANTILMNGLRDLGGKQILSEESSDQEFDWSKEVWIIDPIDGTRLFISGEDDFAILVARWDGEKNGRNIMWSWW